ncbi:MAG: hypothetical protein M1486_03340, partial [Gammaproteobacteria bacterium]|nr:hypothetical protein [Gammaproteobacteria bacterium]
DIILTLLVFLPFSITGAEIKLYNNTNLMLTTIPDNIEMYPGDTVIKCIDDGEKTLLKSPHDWFVQSKKYREFFVIFIEGINTYKVKPILLTENSLDKKIVSIDKNKT